MNQRTLLFLFYLAGLVNAKRPRFVVAWNALNCSYNSDIVEHFNYYILPQQVHFTTEAIFKQELPELMCAASLQIPRPPRGEMLQLFDFEFEVCKFVKSRARNKFLDFVLDGFEKYTNMHRCPFKQHTIYALRNYTVDMDKVPSFTAEMDFMFKINFRLPSKVEVYNGALKGRLEENVRSSLKNRQLFSN